MIASKKQHGFTLIELVVVIVILGILAATALPKFINLSGDAKEASFQGVKGGAASAMNINFAGCAVANHVPDGVKCVRIQNCNEVGTIMQGGMPTGYSVASTALTGNGTEGTCTLSTTTTPVYTPTGSATFTGMGAGSS